MAVASISRRFHHTRRYPEPPPTPLAIITPEPEKSHHGLRDLFRLIAVVASIVVSAAFS
jgi:hypothetical protein